MKKIQELLDDFIKDYKLDEKELDIQALEGFLELQKIDPSLKQLQVQGVHRGVLLLQSENSMQNFQLMMDKTNIIKKVNYHIGKNVLKNIKIDNNNS